MQANVAHHLNWKLGVVLLAAGRSGRMGRPKLLLPWGDTSVLGHLLRLWQQVAATQIAVVCAADDRAIQIELDRLNFPAAHRIPNAQPERGMFSSIRCAADWRGWSAEVTHWAIALGDQPQLQLETLRSLMRFSLSRPTAICQPRRLGYLRHPVILPRDVFTELSQTEAPTLKEFLRARVDRIEACDVDDPGLDIDLDTPADYDRAVAALARVA